MQFDEDCSTEAELLEAIMGGELNLLQESNMQKERTREGKEEEEKEQDEEEEEVIEWHEEMELNDRTFRSHLHVYYELNRDGLLGDNLNDLLLQWRQIKIDSRLHPKLRARYDQLVWAHKQFEETRTKPYVSQLAPTYTLRKKIIPYQITLFNEDSFFKSLKLDDRKKGEGSDSLLQDRLLWNGRSKSIQSLVKVETVDDLLIDSKRVEQFQTKVRTLFEETNLNRNFLHAMVVSGQTGIGKKSMIKFILEDMNIPVEQLSLIGHDVESPLEWFEGVIHPWRPDKKSDKEALSSKRIAVIFSDCDAVFGVRSKQLSDLMQRIQPVNTDRKKKKTAALPTIPKQVLVIFVVTQDVLKGPLEKWNKNKRVDHIKLIPASHEAYREFYWSVRKKVLAVQQEPFPPSTFPVNIPEDTTLLHLMEKRDVRAILNYLNYRWRSMEGMRSFNIQEWRSKQQIANEYPTSLSVFDVMDVTIRRIVPSSLCHLVADDPKNRYRIEQVWALFNIKKRGSPKPDASLHRAFSVRDKRVIAGSPAMILVNVLAFMTGFSSYKAMQNELIDASSLLQLKEIYANKRAVLTKKRYDYGDRDMESTTSSCLPLVEQVTSKLTAYRQYKQWIGAEQSFFHLLQELVTLPSFGWRAYKGTDKFQSVYYGGNKEIRTKQEGQRRQNQAWKESLKPEVQIEMFHQSASSLHFYCGDQIDAFDSKGNKQKKGLRPGDFIEIKVPEKKKKEKEKVATEKKKKSQAPDDGKKGKQNLVMENDEEESETALVQKEDDVKESGPSKNDSMSYEEAQELIRKQECDFETPKEKKKGKRKMPADVVIRKKKQKGEKKKKAVKKADPSTDTQTSKKKRKRKEVGKEEKTVTRKKRKKKEATEQTEKKINKKEKMKQLKLSQFFNAEDSLEELREREESASREAE